MALDRRTFLTFWVRDNPMLLPLVKTQTSFLFRTHTGSIMTTMTGAATGSGPLIRALRHRRLLPVSSLHQTFQIETHENTRQAEVRESIGILESTRVHTLHFSTAARLGLVHGVWSLFLSVFTCNPNTSALSAFFLHGKKIRWPL